MRGLERMQLEPVHDRRALLADAERLEGHHHAGGVRLDYAIVPVDIGGGDQFKPEFLRLSPTIGCRPSSITPRRAAATHFRSSSPGPYWSIWLTRQARFLPASGAARYGVLQWVHWQMANLGPMMGNANHFKNYARNIVEDPALLEYGTNRFVGEVDRLCGVMDARLSANRFLTGPDYTIADIITWPWAMLTGRLLDEAVWASFPNLKRWVDEVRARPAVEKGFRVGRALGERELSEAEQEARRELLFNQTNESVRKAREAAARITA